MIFGQRVFGTVGGGNLGDVVSEQSSSAAVKRVQLILQKISTFTNDGDFDPKSTHGRVNMNTAFALWSVTRKGLAQIPVLNTVVDDIQSLPGFKDVLSCLNKRKGFCSFDSAWTIAKYAPNSEGEDPGWALRDYIINPIRAGAAQIDVALKPIADQLLPGGTPDAAPPFVFQQLVVKYVPFPGAYPEGSVAIRDPLLGKYRIIAPKV